MTRMMLGRAMGEAFWVDFVLSTFVLDRSYEVGFQPSYLSNLISGPGHMKRPSAGQAGRLARHGGL